VDVSYRRQIALFVRAGASVSLAQWTEYEVDGRRRSALEVFKTTRTLLPRDGISQAIETSARDVAAEQIEAWLRERGYEVLSRMEGPTAPHTLRLR